MKRIITLFLTPLLFLFTACSQRLCAEDVLLEFVREYPISSRIYSSLATEDDEGYIDIQMLDMLYETDEYPADDFAIVLYGKVDTVREIGVFVTESGDERIRVSEILSRRIDFLSSFSEGEGFIRKYGRVIVYGFVEDASYAEELFDRIL